MTHPTACSWENFGKFSHGVAVTPTVVGWRLAAESQVLYTQAHSSLEGINQVILTTWTSQQLIHFLVVPPQVTCWPPKWVKSPSYPWPPQTNKLELEHKLEHFITSWHVNPGHVSKWRNTRVLLLKTVSFTKDVRPWRGSIQMVHGEEKCLLSLLQTSPDLSVAFFLCFCV